MTLGPLGLIWPRLLRPIYVAWMVLAFPIGWTISQLILAVMFYGLFTPIGLVFRLIGRDPLLRARLPGRGDVLDPQGDPRRPPALLQAVLEWLGGARGEGRGARGEGRVNKASWRLLEVDCDRHCLLSAVYYGIPMSDTSPRLTSEFEKAAAEDQGESLLSEFWAFLKQNKKWWLLPIVIVMLLLGVLIFLASTPAAPFIYTLF